jgi:hypothetical protein
MAINKLGYYCRVMRKKEFSDNPEVCQERLDLVEDRVTWQPSRVQRICFIDEVWAFGGAHMNLYVIVLKNRSNCLLPEYIRHKYSKLPA